MYRLADAGSTRNRNFIGAESISISGNILGRQVKVVDEILASSIHLLIPGCPTYFVNIIMVRAHCNRQDM